MTIELGRDFEQSPPTICPHCKKELHLIIDAWKPDITKIVRSNCVHCRGEFYAGLFIITDTNMRNILNSIQAVIDLFKQGGGNVSEVDNPQGWGLIQ